MKKFLFLVLLLSGCDQKSDMNYSQEQLVQYNCKTTGEYLVDRDTIIIGAVIMESEPYKKYLYKCSSGDRLSRYLIQKD